MSITAEYEDHDLFKQVAQGNADAYRQLFKNYFPKIYEVALMYTKIPEQAEDIVQGVFLKVWEKKEQLAGVQSPKDWLFIVTRNEVMSSFKKQSLHQGYVEHLKEIFTEEQESPEELIILRQKDEVMKNAVNTLTGKQKEAWLLSREAGLSYAGIAEQMGISKNTVREHITNSLKTLREFLAAHKDQLIMAAGLIVIFEQVVQHFL